ncbi:MULTISPECIES: DNA topoisomerase IB [unclassified Lysobacter]|uniref:DNA topoisomerase IB n=1 Tax=unclassified Lysobacter TaxID=2635362 RepID=UPI0009E81037|nr:MULTISPECIES: DNA topoisomerase IB [unclassified Lysobacter]
MRRLARTTDSPATAPSPGSLRDAAAAGLRYVSDSDPGIARLRSGRGFRYRDAQGRAVRDAATLERIRALAVPPAYTDVWICAHPYGHLQATGRDARGRKQYRYHTAWRHARNHGKFDRIVDFGAALPRLRRRLRADLKQGGLPRSKVLAIVVALMSETLLRVGNDAYARSNGTFGLTTLRNRHLDFLREGRARLHFRGKGGQQHDIAIDDAALVRQLRRCQQLPGQLLFQYRDDNGAIQPVDSDTINAYLREAMDGEFSAKDFRTWGGTLAAFKRLALLPLPEGRAGRAPSERALAQVEKTVVGEVAQLLRNTPAVCRKSYIDPAVFSGWREQALARYAAQARGERQWEQATLRFLKRMHGRRPKTGRAGSAAAS